MIVIIRLPVCPQADWIEAELKALLLGFSVRTVDTIHCESEAKDIYPLIGDSGRTIHGEQSIKHYLKELREFAADWCWFESDSCYVDHQDGSAC